MSSKLFPYLMKNNQWIKSEAISIDDIAVLVDTKRDIIWYFEGEKSSARTKFDARGLLGQLKEKYIPYKFKKIDNRAPKEVLEKLDELKKASPLISREYRGKSIQYYFKVLYSLNIIVGILQIISVVFLTTSLFWPQVYDEQSFLNYNINYNLFVLLIEITSILLFFSLIILIFTSFFGLISRKRGFTLISIIIAITTYFSIAYIRLGNTYLYLYPNTPVGNVLIRADAFLFFIIGSEIILFIGVIGSFSSAFYWLIRRD